MHFLSMVILKLEEYLREESEKFLRRESTETEASAEGVGNSS